MCSQVNTLIQVHEVATARNVSGKQRLALCTFNQASPVALACPFAVVRADRRTAVTSSVRLEIVPCKIRQGQMLDSWRGTPRHSGCIESPSTPHYSKTSPGPRRVKPDGSSFLVLMERLEGNSHSLYLTKRRACEQGKRNVKEKVIIVRFKRKKKE